MVPAPTSARGQALSPTLVSKRDETRLSTWGSQPQELRRHGSGWWIRMDGGGWLQTGSPLPVSKRQQWKGLGPSVFISAFNSIEALDKNYLAQLPSHSLTDPALRQEREGVLNRITVDKLTMNNRPLGPTSSIELPLPGEPSVGFPWRPVPEHLVNLPGIGEPLTAGDPLLSQTRQLPHPLSQISLRKAQWFNLCPMTNLFFKETVEVVKEIAPVWCTQDMHEIMRQLHEAYQSKKPMCFEIREDTPDNMQSMLCLWQHNPEGVPTAIWQEDDGSLNLSNVDIWIWLKCITPSKGMMVRQRLMQLFGEASQWASLVDASKLPAPSSSELCNAPQIEHKFMSLLKAELLLKDLAIWLGKYVGVTLTRTAKIEEYAMRALAKTVHSSASRLGKHLHKMAQTKDHLNCRKQQLIESTKLDSELSMISPTTQLSVMTSSVIAPPPCDKEGGFIETRPTLALYSDGDILMGNIDDSVTDDLYQ